MLFPVFFVMTAAALACFIYPLMRHRHSADALPREGVNVLLFRDRMSELDADLAQSRITPDEHQQLKAELEATLLTDVDGVVESSAPMRKQIWPVVVLIVATPMLALGIYRFEGQYAEVSEWLDANARWGDLIAGTLQGRTVTEEQAKDLTSRDYIRVLQGVLQKNPDNVDGWRQLGVTYLQMGIPLHAETAFRRASVLEPQDTGLILDIIEAKLAQGQGALDPAGVDLLHEVLRRDPAQPKARMMLGMVSFNRNDYAGAIDIWKALLADVPADSEGAHILQATIARAEQKLAAQKSPQGHAAGDVAIQVHVDLLPALEKSIDRPVWLMVYAKQVGGMPMPAAIIKKPFENAPVELTLTDADAVAPMARLSTSKVVKVYARLSKTGAAQPQPGDIIVESGEITVEPGNKKVSLTLGDDSGVSR